MKNHLLIGLGGTGGRVLAAYRKLMFERFDGNVEPKDMWIDYLYVDSSKQDLEMRDPAQWSVMGNWIKLSPSSVVEIPASSDLKEYIARKNTSYPYLAPWIGDLEDWKNIINDPKISEGAAGQKRRLGRLLFANGSPVFDRMVQTKVDKLDENPTSGKGVTFHVVAGLAGGTGSGSVVDVVSQLKLKFPGTEYKVILYLLLPEANENAAWATTDNYHSNGYVALTELSALDQNVLKPWNVSERENEVKRVSEDSPFYSAYLITDTNRENIKFNVQNTMPATVAEFLFQKTAGVAVSDGATESAENFFNDAEKTENPKYSQYDIPQSYKYCSFGIKRLAVPEQEIKEFFGYTFANQALLKMLYNNLSTETGYVAEPTVNDDYAFVTTPEQKKKWYLSREYLCLSEPLPEYKKEGWKSIKDDFNVVDNFARQVHASAEIEHKDKLIAIRNKTKRFYDKDFRPIAEQGQNGVAVFYDKKTRFGRDAIASFIMDKINEDLLQMWSNGERSLTQLSGICQTLLTYFDEEKDSLKRLTSVAADEIKKRDKEMENLNTSWCEMGLGGKLIAAMGGNNKSKLSEAFVKALKQKYILMTWKEGYAFAELLINDLIRGVQVTKGSIDSTISQFVEALKIMEGNINNRCLDEPEEKQNQRGVVIKNYDPKSVHNIAKQAIANATDNGERVKLSMESILKVLNKEKRNFREVEEKLKVGIIIEKLEESGISQATTFFTNEVGHNYIQEYKKLLGVNIIEQLETDYGHNDEGLKKKLAKLVKQAAILNRQRDAEVNNNRGQKIRSSMFVILPNYDKNKDFLQKVENTLKSLTTEGQIKVSRGGNPHEIVVANLEANITPRYLQNVYFLKEKYDKLMNSTQGKVARFETQLEDYNGICPRSKEYCIQHNCLPSLYNPSDEELKEIEKEKEETGKTVGGANSNVAAGNGTASVSIAPPPPPTAEYFVYANNAQTGPFSLQQMQQQVTMGVVTRQTFVWKQGMAGWAAAESVPEISALFATTTPPPPPMMM